jgi:hypothetical protein
LGCTKTFTTNLLEPHPVTPNLSSTNITCYSDCDGTATSNATGGAGNLTNQPPGASPGGYTYQWSGSSTATTPNLTGLCPGTYTLTVTDDSLCTGVQTVIITEPDTLALNPDATMISCGGACDGTASVSPTGGTGAYSYSWTGPGGPHPNAPSISNLCPGTYTVVVTDDNGCEETAVFIITEPDPLDVTVSGTDVICFENCDGTATAVPSGGTPLYNMVWENSAGTVISNTTDLTSTITNLCPDTYTVFITDENNCTINASVSITEPDELFANATSTDMSGSCNAGPSLAA